MQNSHKASFFGCGLRFRRRALFQNCDLLIHDLSLQAVCHENVAQEQDCGGGKLGHQADHIGCGLCCLRIKTAVREREDQKQTGGADTQRTAKDRCDPGKSAKTAELCLLFLISLTDIPR